MVKVEPEVLVMVVGIVVVTFEPDCSKMEVLVMAAIGGYGGYWRLLAAIGGYWRLLVAMATLGQQR